MFINLQVKLNVGNGGFWNSRGCKTDDRTDRRNACYGVYSDDGNAL